MFLSSGIYVVGIWFIWYFNCIICCRFVIVVVIRNNCIYYKVIFCDVWEICHFSKNISRHYTWQSCPLRPSFFAVLPTATAAYWFDNTEINIHMVHKVLDIAEILPDGKEKWLRSLTLIDTCHDLQTKF